MIHEVLHMVTNIPATEEGSAMSEVQPRMRKAGLSLVTPPEESTALAVTKGTTESDQSHSIEVIRFTRVARTVSRSGLGPAGSGSDWL